LARIFVLNGVNLSTLGERRPEVYSEQTLEDMEQLLRGEFPGAEFEFPYAIHDALEAVSVPKVEVHLSNVHFGGGVWRHTSVISPVVDAVVAGMGVSGYRAAAEYILSLGSSGR
jgi:3-dehydroquinate dehydratase II